MNEGGTCTEQGPYFPPTPLYFVQNGLTLDSTILLEPDWFMIAMLLLVSILVVSILVVALTLFRRYGWAKSSFLSAYYRAVGYAFNLDTYSSKVSVDNSMCCSQHQLCNAIVFVPSELKISFSRDLLCTRSRNTILTQVRATILRWPYQSLMRCVTMNFGTTKNK